MSYRIIRLSEGYEMAIIASPEDAEPLTPGVKFWLLNDNMPGFETFKKTDFSTVLHFFSGHADGMGFANLPEAFFKEVKDAENWILENKIKFYEEKYKDLVTQEELKEILEDLKNRLKGEINEGS